MPERIARYWPLWFLILIPLVAISAAVFGGEAIGPHDHLQPMVSVERDTITRGKGAWDVLQADGVLQFYVWRDLVFESWRNKTIPGWNPYTLGGTPLLANSQSGGFYPLHILVGVLGIPTQTGVTLLAWFHLAFAGLGVYKLTRQLGGCKLGGAIAGASFTLSPFMLGWIPLSSVITTVAWIPWALFAVARANHHSSGTSRSYAILAIAVGMMALGGHLQFVAYGIGAILLCDLGWKIASRKPAGFLVTVASIGLGLAIAAPQLLPVLEYSKSSHRTGVKPDYEAYISTAIKPWELANLVYPMALGNPVVPVNADTDVASYWPPLAKRGANWTESAVSPGPMVIWLLCLVPLALGVWKSEGKLDRLVVPMGVSFLFLLLALGTPLNRVLYSLVPGWSATGSPGRAISLFVLLACVAGGVTLSTFLKSPPKPRSFQFTAVAFVLISFLTLTLSTMGVGPLQGMDPKQFETIVGTATVTAMPIALLLIIFTPQAAVFTMFRRQATSRSRPLEPALLWIPAFLVVSSMWGVASVVRTAPVINMEGAKNLVGENKSERVAVINDNWEIVTGARTIFPPNLLSLARVRDIGGYDSLMSKETKILLDEISGGDASPPANGNMAFVKSSADKDKLAEAGVDRIISLSPKGIDSFATGGPGRISVSTGTLTVFDDKPGYITVNVKSDSDTVLTIRDRNLPGWTAKLNSGPLRLNDGLWLQVRVPAGDHLVTLSYFPPKLMLWPALIGLVIVGFLAFPPPSRKQITEGNKNETD